MKKIFVVLTILGVMALTACKSSDNVQNSQSKDSAAGEENSTIANPWTESDAQGVLDATGFELIAPDGATDATYRYNESEGIAEMTYVLDGGTWTYRMQSASELTDISGMYYDWTLQDEGLVANMPAQYLAYSDATEDTEYIDNVFGVEVVNWFDETAQVVHSLSISGTDINGIDIQVFAEQLL